MLSDSSVINTNNKKGGILLILKFNHDYLTKQYPLPFVLANVLL